METEYQIWSYFQTCLFIALALFLLQDIRNNVKIFFRQSRYVKLQLHIKSDPIYEKILKPADLITGCCMFQQDKMLVAKGHFLTTLFTCHTLADI